MAVDRGLLLRTVVYWLHDNRVICRSRSSGGYAVPHEVGVESQPQDVGIIQ